MISLNVLFYIFVILFAIIGFVRGLRKEVIVVVSGILAIFIIEVIVDKIFPTADNTKTLIIDLTILFVMAFFGYQTPAYRSFAESGKFERDSLLHMILGGLTGAFNGYLLFSSAWHYLAKAGYPFSWISAPDLTSEVGQTALKLLENSFPKVVSGTWLYVVLAASVAVLLAVII